MIELFMILTFVYIVILHATIKDISKSQESNHDRLKSTFYKTMANYEDRHSSYCKGLNKEIVKLKIEISKLKEQNKGGNIS